ncbi:MAG: SusC/RagA family TonB-linked outer membrane protein [Chitinophagia bacterium]|nr:SusC/RagA family TonB-linked outer membrane protein [Chitinophagia bacterium]
MTKQLHLPRLGRLLLTTVFLTCLVGFAVAQRTVSGKVTDAETRAPLGGVSVVAKGSTNGTATDAEGNFKIDLKADQKVLAFSFNGYVTRDVAATANMNVALEVDVRALQSVVVTGYTSQRKKDITGAVAVVDAKQLTATPAASVTQMLQGKASGVIVGNDNSPGGGTMVRIRGFGTINNNSPLSAASIYGARAANGVVIITTKKGKAGDPKINFDYYTGTQVPGKLYDLLNAEEYGKWLFKSEVGAGRTPWVTSPSAQYKFDQSGNVTMSDYVNPAIFGTAIPTNYSYTNDISDPEFLKTKFNFMMSNKAGTDWQDVIYDPAPISNYQVGASGGTKNAKYSFSANAFNQDGILRFTNYQRYSIRANTEFTYGKFTVGENLTFSYDRRKGITNNAENEILLAVRIQPIIPVFDVTGGPKALGGTNTSDWNGFGGPRGPNLGNATNPLAELYRAKDNYTYGTHMFGNSFAEYAILKNLKARSSMGIEYNNFNTSAFFMRQIEAAEPRNTNSLTVSNSFDNSWTWYNTLNYNTTIKDNHDINVLAGTEAVATYSFGFNASRSTFAFNDIDYRYLNAGSAAGLANAGSGAIRTRLFSQFAKVNYGYKNLLLADFTIRRDGSSRFSSAYRYGVFPAGSLGVRLTELKALSNLSWLDDLKVRAGWGKTGNQLIPNVYNSYTLYASDPANNGYDIAGTGTSVSGGFDLTQFGNPNGRWETTTSANVGFDASMFNSKLDVVFDWYTRTTSDMLAQIAVARAQGQGTIPFTNIGTMNNKGVDLNIDWKDKAFGGKVRYSVGLNFTHYRNEVLKLNNDPNATLFGFTTRIPSITATKKGYPIASFYGFWQDGFVTATNASTVPKYGNYTKEGSFNFRDVNGDGVVTAADRTILGNPHPDFIYGLNLTAGYKNWDLAVFAKGTYGNQIFNYVRYWTDFNTFQGNRSKRMLYESYGETANPKLPKINASDGVSGAVVSSYFLEDGSYLRLSNVQLTYSIPDNIMKKIGLTGAQLYVQGQNILTVTKYTGMDPDINIRTSQNNNQDFHMGIDEGAYPVAKQYLFGVRVKF